MTTTPTNPKLLDAALTLAYKYTDFEQVFGRDATDVKIDRLDMRGNLAYATVSADCYGERVGTQVCVPSQFIIASA